MMDDSKEKRLQTTCLLILTVIATGAAAYWLKEVLLPFTFAVLLALLLDPLVEFLSTRLRIPQPLAVFLTLGVGLLLLGVLTVVLSQSLLELAQSGPAYSERVAALISWVVEHIPLHKLGVKTEQVLAAVAPNPAEAVGAVLTEVINGMWSLLSHGVIVLIYLVFLLAGRSRQGSLWRDIRKSIEGYMLLKTTICLLVASLTWMILNLLGVQLALVFGLLAFVLNYIPNIGPVVATLLPLPVVVLSPDISVTTAVLALVLPGIVHFGVGHLLEPFLMGDSLELDPVVVLLTLMILGVIWGPVGMLLATPVTAVARMLLDRWEFSQPMAKLLAGRALRREPVVESALVSEIPAAGGPPGMVESSS